MQHVLTEQEYNDLILYKQKAAENAVYIHSYYLHGDGGSSIHVSVCSESTALKNLEHILETKDRELKDKICEIRELAARIQRLELALAEYETRGLIDRIINKPVKL